MFEILPCILGGLSLITIAWADSSPSTKELRAMTK